MRQGKLSKQKQRRGTGRKVIRKSEGEFFVPVFISLTCLIPAIYFLNFFLNPVGTIQRIAWIYFAYFLYVIVFAHLVFFFTYFALEERENRLRNLLPKYIEYGYVAVISVSILQVLYFSPQLADFVLQEQEEPRVFSQIRSTALSEIERHSNPLDEKYYTAEYCALMKTLSQHSDLKGYIIEHAGDGQLMLNHVVSETLEPKAAVVVSEYPPTAQAIERILTRHNLLKDGNVNEFNFKWFAFLLLPFGIALRLVKTSLELFISANDTSSSNRKT